MEKNHPVLWRLIWLTGLGLVLVAILALPSNLLWLQSSLLMFWVSISILALLRIFLFESDYLAPASFLMFYFGCLMLTVFLVWLGNASLKLVFNSFFTLVNWNFKIGSLFPEVWNYALSLPALICGTALAVIGVLWNSDIKYHILKSAIIFFQRID